MTSRDPRVVAVILNFNGSRVLPDCLRTLGRSTYPELKIVVVDNASTDGSPDWIVQHAPEVQLLRNPDNCGWSAGNNTGIRWALFHGADYVWILNNDVEIDPDCLRLQMAAFETRQALGMVSPLIYYLEPRTRVWFAGAYVDSRSFELNHLHSLEAFRRVPNEQRYLSGCSLLVKREVFDRIGLLDERYFLYYDDVDFSVCAAGAGFELDVVSEAVMYHKVSAAAGSEDGSSSPLQTYHLLRSGLLFWRKHAGFRRFHREYCAGFLAKWVNRVPEFWADEKSRPRAEAIMDAVWYVLTAKHQPKSWSKSPEWFRRIMLSRPWLVAEAMSFQFGRVILDGLRRKS